ncbi:chorismate synthase [Lapidilactobacillus mulanensis]|uniref:Chorismate synthase n=1 Tax=Lapidilactobacillus mulanensis TaxID=2485999 RepID=A0ABW4DNF1_9LACO|nr:chorismate synthase [Lapidilactobacillus mulanensis]
MEYVTAGESHGPYLTAIISGFPANVQLDQQQLLADLRQRQIGYGRGERMKIETDQVQIVGGVRYGKTLGSPIALMLANRDYQNWHEVMSVWPTGAEKSATVTKRIITKPRPGHADLVGGLKYDQQQDLRNVLERASARETAMRVAVGSLCKQFLSQFGIAIVGAVTQIGQVALSKEQLEKISQPSSAANFKREIITPIYASPVRTIDPDTAQRMQAAIDQAYQEQTTLGGKIRVVVQGLPIGLGSYVSADQKLDSRLSAALMSINAIKGVSFGDGFNFGRETGRAALDPIIWCNHSFQRAANHQGGLEGGMTNGMPLVIDLVMKPIPTQTTGAPSVDMQTHESVVSTVERSDITAVPAASVIAEAMTAITIMQAFCEMFGHDENQRIKQNFDHYLDYLKKGGLDQND